MRVLLAEDHTIVRSGIRLLLENLSVVEAVLEAADGREALRLTHEFHPDVILMDITMPELNGLEATEQIKKDFPRIPVIILSVHAGEEYVVHALKAGASGYMVKDSDTEELDLALRAVMKGDTYLSHKISRGVVTDYLRRLSKEPKSPEQLTRRQREILQLIAEGHTTKEIAIRLRLSEKTVQSHRMQLMDRLGVHDIAGLVRYAVRTGLIQAE
jgi:DNA-binding NarL/FixJ family response regulator